MANKRTLKKFIRNTCGAIAAETLMATAIFPEIKEEDAHNIVRKAAHLQAEFLPKVNVAGRTFVATVEKPTHMATPHRNPAVKALIEEFDKAVVELVKEMNAIFPDSVKQVLKQTVNE